MHDKPRFEFWDAEIQALCRWQTSASLLIYKRMQAQQAISMLDNALTATITSRGEVTRFIGVSALPFIVGLCIIYRLVIASLVLMVERPKRGAFGFRSIPAFFFTLRSMVLDVALGAWIDCALFHDTLWGCQKS